MEVIFLCELGDDVVISRAPGVIERRLLDGIIVIAPGDGGPVRVSTPGDLLWRMLDEPCAVEDLAAVWATLRGVAPDQAFAEVEPALRAWLTAGAVIATPPMG